MAEEAIRMQKRIAMYGEGQANHLKKGGKAVKHYAKGGQVMLEGTGSKQPAEITHQEKVNKITAYPEKVIRNLPAKGNVKPVTKAMPHSIATMKRGGKAAGRGR
jgi:hypothetical protein